MATTESKVSRRPRFQIMFQVTNDVVMDIAAPPYWRGTLNMGITGRDCRYSVYNGMDE